MTVKEIKRKRSRSHNAILAVLQSALIEARENQYKGVAIALLGKDQDVSDFFIVPGTEISGLALLLEELKDEVKGTKYEA